MLGTQLAACLNGDCRPRLVSELLRDAVGGRRYATTTEVVTPRTFVAFHLVEPGDENEHDCCRGQYPGGDDEVDVRLACDTGVENCFGAF